jgi:hypothetical protein
MVMARETKEIYAEYKHLFDFFKGETSDLESSIIEGSYRPLKVYANTDMLATWKGIGLGGAVKRDTNPCHCCSIQSKELVIPNAIKCTRWCSQCKADASREDGFCCYHQEFLSEEGMMEMQEEIEAIVTNLAAGAYISNIEDVFKKAKLRTDEDPQAPLASFMHDILSTHF